MNTTVIIPNYNGAHFLPPCLEALKNQTVSPAEIIVVDNGSSDDSIQLLETAYPNVRIIVNEENLGFAAAVNIGIKASSTAYVLLLNNDTEADPGMIEHLERAMRRNPKAFSIASKMVQLYYPDLLDSTGDLYTVVGWAVNRGTGRPSSLYNRAAGVFSACAGAALYRREVFERIGYFDEKHFCYLEDIDVGWRARLYGYRNIYEPKAVVRHVGSGTSGSKYNSFKVRLSARNSVWLNYKNMPLWQLILNALPLAAGYLVKTAFFIHKGFAKDYLGGIKEGVKTRRECAKVSDTPHHFLSCLLIQLELIINFVLYVADWLRRKSEEHRAKKSADNA